MSESLFIKTLRGERSSETPIWLMRQAGRYLPEYRKIREGRSMLEMVQTPEIACEVTLQPLKRFPLDAGIIFADILTPLIGMGVSLDFKKGEGPVLANPVRSMGDISKLRLPTPQENVGYTLKAIELVVRELGGRTPLIGFSGAPFTLSSYLIEGQSPGDLQHTKAMMVSDPKSWHHLQEKLVSLCVEYLVAQVEAGCEALQIFDSWLGYVGPREYDLFVEPYLTQIIKQVKGRVAVPIIFFATGVNSLLPRLGRLPADAFGVDWRTSLPDAGKALGRPVPLQGNLDPQLLAASWEYTERSAKSILSEALEVPAHVFNLGHGVLQYTPVENVERLIQLVKGYRR